MFPSGMAQPVGIALALTEQA